MKAVKLWPSNVEVGEPYKNTVNLLRQYFETCKDVGTRHDMLIAKVFLYAKTPLDLWRLREKAVDAVKVAFDDSDTIAWAQICTNAVKFDSNVPSYKCCISIEFEKE